MMVLILRNDRPQYDWEQWHNHHYHFEPEELFDTRISMRLLADENIVERYEIWDAGECIERWPYPSTFHTFFK